MDLAQRAAEIAATHRANAAGWVRRGKDDKAAEAIAAAEKQEAIARNHAAEAERLAQRAQAGAYLMQDGMKAKAALEARAAAQKAERLEADPLQAFIEASQHTARHEESIANLHAKLEGLLRVGDKAKAERVAARIEERASWADGWRKEALALIASSGRDLAGEWAALVEEKRKAETLEADAAKARKEMRIPIDLRTAGAQREFVAGSSREAKIASLAEYENLIARPADRTAARVQAMATFDRLCSWAEEGLFPTMNMEAKSRGTATATGAFHTGYADALNSLDRVRHAIGGQNFQILKARIYERQTITALARAGFGTEKTAGALTLAAVDLLAMHLRGQSDLVALANVTRALEAASAGPTP